MLMTEEVFSITIWSLIYATLVAPIVFKLVLNKYTAKITVKEQKEAQGSEDSDTYGVKRGTQENIRFSRTHTAACGVNVNVQDFDDTQPSHIAVIAEDDGVNIAELQNKLEKAEDKVKERDDKVKLLEAELQSLRATVAAKGETKKVVEPEQLELSYINKHLVGC